MTSCCKNVLWICGTMPMETKLLHKSQSTYLMRYVKLHKVCDCALRPNCFSHHFQTDESRSHKIYSLTCPSISCHSNFCDPGTQAHKVLLHALRFAFVNTAGAWFCFIILCEQRSCCFVTAMERNVDVPLIRFKYRSPWHCFSVRTLATIERIQLPILKSVKVVLSVPNQDSRTKLVILLAMVTVARLLTHANRWHLGTSKSNVDRTCFWGSGGWGGGG